MIDGMNTTLESVSLLESLSTERLEAEITTFAAHMAAAMCRWLLLVAEYDRRGRSSNGSASRWRSGSVCMSVSVRSPPANKSRLPETGDAASGT